ncbi:MAG: hypothetical protein ACK5V5_12360 [Cyclobacteriaceae bacterium]|jgi:hypothetical protein|nr:hypothetical protein [Flammeovirgaceae bacterium]
MKIHKKILTAALAAALISSCTYNFPESQDKGLGQVDFAKMVSIGNSLTAGFMDGALYTAGQENSYPAIIARQADLIGGSETFNQPTVNSANGCFNPTGGCTQGRLILKNPAAPAPTPTTGDGGSSLAPFTAVAKNQINNWGVPGVTIQTAQSPALGGPPTANPLYNPFYARIASAPGTSTLLGDAVISMQNGGTFFTFWLGNNDVLGYATGGASNPAILTSQPAFAAAYNNALNAMLGANANAKGAVANIPNVTSIPFFRTVPVNPINLPAANATALNTAFAGYNATLDALKGVPFNLPVAEMDSRKITFVAGPGNRVVLNDENARDLGPFWDQLQGAGAITAGQRAALEPYRTARQAIIPTQTTVGDFIILPAASFIGTVVGGNPQLLNGITVPLADNWVLIPQEQSQIQTAIDGFNSTIATAVNGQAARLVLVDVNKALEDVRLGLVTINGSLFTSSILPPFGAFSLDGVHPNQRGHGYMANLFIDAINRKWGAAIPLCTPNDLPGNALPIP